MHKYGRNAFLGFLLLILPAACRSIQEQLPTDETSTLRTKVQSESPPAFAAHTDDGGKLWKTTQKVYELRGFRPLWIAPEQTSRVDSLIRTFGSTEADGLSAEDLGMADLQSKREVIKTSKDQAQLIDVDLYFTYSLVRCASYLSSGRADPRTIDPNWRYVPHNDNLAQIVSDAIEANTLEQLPTKLAPQLPEYVALKEMLRKYREIKTRGGWAALPAELTLKQGQDNPSVAVLRNNLVITGDLKTTDASTTVFDGEMSEAVQRFQARHGLKADGVVNPAVIAIMNVPVDYRIGQLTANLERLRWLPNDMGARYILVNIPAYELEVHDGNQVALRMKVVVGEDTNRTPIFSDMMKTVVFSPYWNVPESIATKEMLPKIAKDKDYLLRQNIEVIKVNKTAIQVMDPSKINWSEPAGDFHYELRQKPGVKNSLGLVKFLFPNEFNVYLHDTDADNLFDRLTRNFSHGCVRVEHAEELAAYVLRDQPEWTPEKIKQAMHAGVQKFVTLKSPIIVHIVYWTAWVDSTGVLQIRPDVYGYGYAARAAARRVN